MTNPPEMNAAWLAQFSPVQDEKLTPAQVDFLAKIRKQFPGARAGERAGRLDFYVIDKELGPIAGHFPG